MSTPDGDRHSWNPDLYEDKHSYVWKLGSSLLEMLAPQPGERILDLGCGTGQLTAQIAESGAEVVGLDASETMLREGRRLAPDVEFRLGDAHDFKVSQPFDAVFSNAALHWMQRPQDVAGCISRSLKPSGRLVVEFGGKGNVRYLSKACEEVFGSIIGRGAPSRWYFPSIAEFASLLESHDLEVTQAALIDRPTPLAGDDGLRDWVRMFGRHWLDQIPEAQRDEYFRRVEDVARPTLYKDGCWHADYRRLRASAIKCPAR